MKALVLFEKSINTSQRQLRNTEINIVRLRFRQGRLVEEASNDYGKQVVDKLSKAAGISASILYACARWYAKLGTEAELDRLLGQWEDAGVPTNWTRARNWTLASIKKSPPKEAKSRHDRTVNKIEHLAKALERAIEESMEEVVEYNDEQVGVLVHAKEIITDTAAQVTTLRGATFTERDKDPQYLAYIRSQRCINPDCPSPGNQLQAHHVDRKSQGGSDYSALPLCLGCHLDLHGGSRLLDDLDVWHEAWDLLRKYLQTLPRL